jgi:L-amino acid N-acyltransferase YncA
VTEVTIRPATADDAPRIGAVQVLSWQSAYAGLIPQDHLDGLDQERSGQRWLRALSAQPGPRTVTLVVERDGEVVGFAHFGPAQDEGMDPATVADLRTIYLVPRAWGTGTGRALMAAALESMVAAGFRSAMLWVLDTNERAQRFYTAAGWAPDGAAKVDDSLGPTLSEIRYRRDLVP